MTIVFSDSILGISEKSILSEDTAVTDGLVFHLLL